MNLHIISRSRIITVEKLNANVSCTVLISTSNKIKQNVVANL